MYKACSKCGKVHPASYQCRAGAGFRYSGEKERKLRSKFAWTNKSKEIREKANYLCEVCRDENKYIYKGVEVHHIVKLSANSEGLLENYNLICLCADHHRLADEGKIDADYLRELARRREEMVGSGNIPPTLMC